MPEGEDEEQEMGDESKEVSEEDMDKANDMRSEAMSAISDGDLNTAVSKFSDAIKLNPGSLQTLQKFSL